MNDIFPRTFSSFVRPVKHPQSCRGFKAVYRGLLLKRYEIIIKEDIIHFRPVGGCDEQLLMKLFLKVGKDSYFPRYFHPRELIWDDVASCLKRKSTSPIDNSNRICFRYGNTYLTKSYFTFGQRYVNEGTNHIYQTTNAPIVIYIFKSPSTKVVEPTKLKDLARKKNSVFYPKDQYLYNSHILEPNRVYKIPDLTYYLIVTTQSTLFSVNIIKSTTLLPFSLCRNPQNSKNYSKKVNNHHVDSTQQLTPPNHVLEDRGNNAIRLKPSYTESITEVGAEVNYTDFGLDFELDFNKELLALSYDEVIDYFKTV